MKATYLPKNRSKRPYLIRVFILLAILILGAIVFRFVAHPIVSIVSPIWKAENKVMSSLRNSATFFTSQKSLVAENDMLKERLYFLEREMISLSNERIQEEVLFDLLGRKERSEEVVASVLSRPSQTPYDVIIIDVGSNDSISVGSQVSLPEGPILGLVSEVFPASAKVKLFSANGEETNAILERNQLPVTLIGTGGGNFKMALPRDVEIKKEDRILFADIFSRPVATVGEIVNNPTDSFIEVLAKSPTNIFTLRFVFVLP
jgi:cell shape-determining protein MreC